MQLSKILPMSKRGQTSGLITGFVIGMIGLILLVIISFVFISTLTSSNLLTANSAEDNATDRLVGNYTSGIDNVSSKIPTIFLVASIVIVLGVFAFLFVIWKKMSFGGSSI